MPDITRAISIRQPFAELILRGDKRAEYRSQLTNIRERVFIYASKNPAESPEAWERVGSAPGELPTGLIVGSVEITDCRWDGRSKCYAYVLKAARRLRKPLRPTNQPQPKFWIPKY